jgi:pyruvate/2-oxoacid:ferredoxin oxidoreductase beta subunit
MQKYKATATVQYSDQKNIAPVIFTAASIKDAVTWVQNYCDCSYKWDINSLINNQNEKNKVL